MKNISCLLLLQLIVLLQWESLRGLQQLRQPLALLQQQRQHFILLKRQKHYLSPPSRFTMREYFLKLFNQPPSLSDDPNINDNETTSSPAKLNENECYYSILEVSPSSTPEEIKVAYQKLVSQYHPRTKIHLKDIGLANRQMYVINQAYAILRNPITRKRYDQQRHQGLVGAQAGIIVTDQEMRANTARLEQVFKENTKKLWNDYLHHPEEKKNQNITEVVLKEDFIPHHQQSQKRLNNPQREVYRSLEKRYEQVDQEVNEVYAMIMRIRRSAKTMDAIQSALLYLYRLKDRKNTLTSEAEASKDEVSVYRRAKMKEVVASIVSLIRELEEELGSSVVNYRNTGLDDDDDDGEGEAKKRKYTSLIDDRDYSQELTAQTETRPLPQRIHHPSPTVQIDHIDDRDSASQRDFHHYLQEEGSTAEVNEDDELKQYAERFLNTYSQSDAWKQRPPEDGNDKDDGNDDRGEEEIGDIFNNDSDYEKFLESADEFHNVADVFSQYDARDFTTGKALHDPLLLKLLGIKNATNPQN